jgi:hypothetical protein
MMPINIAPQQHTYAYLVAWLNKESMEFIDAGIYSEPRPTSIDVRNIWPIVICKTVSGHPPGEGGFERAVARLRALVRESPAIGWVYQMPSFAKQEEEWRRRAAARQVETDGALRR